MDSASTADVVNSTGEGASAGFQTGGPWGALIGGIVGFAGGMWSSKYRRRARQLQANARALRQDAVLVRSFAEQRNLLRQGQVAAANAIAGFSGTGADVASSGAQGVKSSIYTQLMDNFLLGEKIVQDQIQANANDQAAGKQIEKADFIRTLLSGGAAAAKTFGSNSPGEQKDVNTDSGTGGFIGGYGGDFTNYGK